ncbi:Protein CBG27989 [Caenorhabditis briggsae]|uniref:Protein CBG27989 n=1 Tax=Caenorhabditis briggsae TaxID=6238 RepID=B6IJT1_CAEBR|nr:Protein CBG27989 [Caenorhabditis briggsae]CAS00161.1 Protein CBG27989 [Caenorhabditis briggsae]
MCSMNESYYEAIKQGYRELVEEDSSERAALLKEKRESASYNFMAVFYGFDDNGYEADDECEDKEIQKANQPNKQSVNVYVEILNDDDTESDGDESDSESFSESSFTGSSSADESNDGSDDSEGNENGENCINILFSNMIFEKIH